MYLQANPGRARNEQEKEALRDKYKPGDHVLPKVEDKGGDSADEEQRRMIEQVQEMSLREVGIRGSRSHERRTRHRSRNARHSDTRQSRHHGPETRRQHDSPAPLPEPQGSASRGRRIEHQSSLRSIMSNSDIDSSEMEEEILRLVDEGWLDGIDLNSLDVAQVDELSERIADAYRRRHRHRSTTQTTRIQDPNISQIPPSGNSRESSGTRYPRSINAVEQRHNSSHPPVSRPHLLEAYPTDQGRRLRASSEHRRQTSPNPRSSASRSSSEIHNQASRSATDLSNSRQSSSRPRPLDLTSQSRSVTDPGRGLSSQRAQEIPTSNSETNNRTQTVQGSPDTFQVTERSNRSAIPLRPAAPRTSDSPTRPNNPSPRRAQHSPSVSDAEPAATGSPTSKTSQAPHMLFEEPSICCNRCGKQDLQYELHQNCYLCENGKYNLCTPCYRQGLGCLHWFGFGSAALHKYRQKVAQDGHRSRQDPPHVFNGHRYSRPDPRSMRSSSGLDSRSMSLKDPAKRLQAGVFCSNCSAFANSCFWKCDICNEGEWGFCNQCVNQGKCCTHSLIPIAHSSTINATSSEIKMETKPYSVNSPRQGTDFRLWGLPTIGQYVPLSFNIHCAVCRYPIQSTNSRFHCPQCNDGDHDICNNSYLELMNIGRISSDNGDKGWRRCLNGHRMTQTGFEDSPVGQRRIVVRDLVGGHALKQHPGSEQSVSEEWSWPDGQSRQVRNVSKRVADSSNEQQAATPLLRKYPPDGGVGMRAQALWSYWPQIGAQDELAFPKGAEIWEVADINKDWFWGCYAGAKGLFPGNYVRVVENVTI